MHIVSDAGADIVPETLAELDLHIVPLTLTLDGKSYRSGVDIQPDAFYEVLAQAEGLPTTSQPSPGDFAELYRRLAQSDPEILSVHISSGLSGTMNAAREGAKLVPEAEVTLFDTKTLSGAQGWHVLAAAQAAKAGWTMGRIVAMLNQIRTATETIYTLPTLKYLIHGGRISHIKGLIASMLNIKPLIGVDKKSGKYYERGKKRTMARAMTEIVNVVAQTHGEGAAIRCQVLHASNPSDARRLRQMTAQRFECTWLPTAPIAPVLGAHTGAGLVGLVYAAQDAFPNMP